MGIIECCSYQIMDSERLQSLMAVDISSGASSQDFNPDSVVYHLSDLGKLFNFSDASIFLFVKWA